ncbi:MAG: dihydroorotate dehydrogenase electron transfer subunit [Syntrophorhabdaceae bacterium]|nr:dihydroorotate dehydrogenase electron transfer subunit [Syntrophorhabdaceae bacterium]
MRDFEGEVIKNEHITKDFFIIEFRLQKPIYAIEPGQFVMVKIPDERVFLRRPFSIYDCNKNSLSIMYRIKGEGTHYLSKTPKGIKTQILGPLGKGFNINFEDHLKPVIIAGGIGIAGVHLLIKKIKKTPDIFYGCSDEKEVKLIEDLKAKHVYIATMDGSFGFKGDVISLFERHLKHYQSSICIYACGPEAMFKSLKEKIKPEIKCEVLLEERMACGMGLCFGCVKKTLDEKEPYKRVCKEGPVFDIWQISL